MVIQMNQSHTQYLSANSNLIPLQKNEQSLADSMPKLISLKIEKTSTQVANTPPTMLRIPINTLESRKTNLYTTSTPFCIPKLVDLRVVLQQPGNNHVKAMPKLLSLPKIDEKVKLVKLPHQQQQVSLPTKLLDPKLNVATKKTKPNLSMCNAIDLQLTGHNEPQKILSPPKLKFKPNRKRVKGHESSSSQTLSLSIDNLLRKSKKKDYEDELFKAISNLILKRKKEKITRKLRISDIIDNFPLSSESETDEEKHNFLETHCSNKFSTKKDKIGCAPNGLFEKNILQNAASQIYTPSLGVQCNQNIANTSKHFEHSDDPLSWLNIIRSARLDTKHTQTDQLPPKVSCYTKECQTELKEMLEIPRTITILESNNSFEMKNNCMPLSSKNAEKINVEKEDVKILLIKADVDTQTNNTEDNINDAAIMPIVAKKPNLPGDVNNTISLNCHQNRSKFMDMADSNQPFYAVQNPNENGSFATDNFKMEKSNHEEDIFLNKQVVPLAESKNCDKRKHSTSVFTKDERSWLKENLCGFSLNLKTLEELHHKLEFELSKTKSLYSPVLLNATGSAAYPQPTHSFVDMPYETYQKTKRNNFLTKNEKNELLNDEVINSNSEPSTDLLDKNLYKINKSLNEEIHEDVENEDQISNSIVDMETIKLKRSPVFSPDITHKFSENSEFMKDDVHFSGDANYLLKSKDYIENKKRQDEIFKEEIRQRIQSNYMSPTFKQNSEKQIKLLAWMKVKQKEKLADYKIQLEKQRSAEHKPLLNQGKVQMQKEIQEKTRILDEKKRNMFENHHAERMLAAEKLARAVKSSLLNNKSESANLRKFTNNRKSTRIPVRETHSSRLRRNALLLNVFNLKKSRDKKTAKKPPRVTYGNSIQDPVTPSGRAASIRSVEPQEFITKKSYDRYKVNSAKRRLKSLKSFTEDIENSFLSNNDSMNESLLDAYNFDISPRLQVDRLHNPYKKNPDKQTVGNYPVDSSSETIQLLAEVDLALLDDEILNVEPTQNLLQENGQEPIDWDEVDKILNIP